MAKSGKLSEEAKAFIVQSLACYDRPSVIVAAVKRDYGQTISLQAVENYDPAKYQGRNLPEKWRVLFEETRKTFLADTAAIGASHKAVRLRALERMALKAEEQRNLALAASIYEQIAKECGDAYTNRRELTGRGGAPLVPKQPATVVVLPDNGRG